MNVYNERSKEARKSAHQNNEFKGTISDFDKAKDERMVSLLLNAIPEAVKTEIVTSRHMAVAQILFALYIKYQPGGQGERISLIKYLTDIKALGGGASSVHAEFPSNIHAEN